MLWLQSVLSIRNCKGTASQTRIKNLYKQTCSTYVFIRLLSWCRGGNYYWNSCLVLVNMSPRSHLLNMKQRASPRVAKATKRKEWQEKKTFYTAFKLQCHWNQNLKMHCRTILFIFYVPKIHNSLLNIVSILFLKSSATSTEAWSVLILDLHVLLFYKLVLHML